MIKATNTYFLMDYDNCQIVAKGSNKGLMDKYAKKNMSGDYLRVQCFEDLEFIDDAHFCSLMNNVFGQQYTVETMPDRTSDETGEALFNGMAALALPLINKSVEDKPLQEIPMGAPKNTEVVVPAAAPAAPTVPAAAPAPAAPAAATGDIAAPPAVPPAAAPVTPAPIVPSAAPVAPNMVAPTAAPIPAQPAAPAAAQAPAPAVAPAAVTPAPVEPAAAPSAPQTLPGPVAGPVATNVPAPVTVYPEPKVGHPTYQQMIDAGWTDETLAGTEYEYLTPHLAFPDAAPATPAAPAVPGAPAQEEFVVEGFDKNTWLQSYVAQFKAKGQKTRFGAQSKNCGLGVFNVNQKKSGLFEIWVRPEDAAHFDCCKGTHEPKVAKNWVAIQKISKEQVDTILTTYLGCLG